MTRFQKLTVTTLAATYVLVVLGAFTRGTGSGMGCPDWPLCHGQLLPSVGDDAAWVEWMHRTWAALVGVLVLAVAVVAYRKHRGERSLVTASIAAVILTAIQAGLGEVTVATQNEGQWVTAHLATAMILLALLAFVAVRSRYSASLQRRPGSSQRLTLLLAFTAACVYALLLFGSQVTATTAALVFPDWPLFNGALLPAFSADPAIAALQIAQWLHRIVSVVVGVVLAGTTLVVWRAARDARRSNDKAGGVATGATAPGPATTVGRFGATSREQILLGLVGTSAALYAVQVIVGAMQIFTTLASWAVILHLALGALIWGLLVTATLYAYYEARSPRRAEATSGEPATAPPTVPAPVPAVPEATATSAPDAAAAGSGTPAANAGTSAIVGWRQRTRAYVALTKPRIIELLLVTTVPAMIVAQRGIPPLWLIFWTLVGGSLAAGSANAINCYLDRDIDLLMTRTRRRPLPANAVEPEDALLFGLALGVVSFGVLAVFTNLVAAFLTLIAIAFYVVIYTMLLKRSTPQNIVLGGAAGALPPVIGWAAVTGDIGLPALVLFAIVFYWTPPHFWALSMRLSKDYAAANVPMMPVTHGVPETTRQIGLYSVLMVALTLLFFAVAHMGLIYLAGALLLGGIFMFQAFAMWREGTDRRAIRLYKFSITYLSALFALMVIDVLVLPLG